MRTAWMSAPVAWHRRDSSFMNDTRIASIVFDAYFVSSLDRGSVTTRRSPDSCSGAYRARSVSRASSLRAPSTMRSGRKKSSTAVPSFRNSGFDTTSSATLALLSIRS